MRPAALPDDQRAGPVGDGRAGVPGPRTAVANPMDDRWPSPIWRRLIATRSCPASSPAWSGWATIDGLHSAAASTAYSWLK